MATTVESVRKLSAVGVRPRLNALQKYLVMHANPVKLLIDAVGFLWAAYFTYQHLWLPAAVSVVIFEIGGAWAARESDLEALSRTRWGEFWLALAKPSILVLNVIAFGVVLYGLWQRVGFIILGGASLELLVAAAASSVSQPARVAI